MGNKKINLQKINLPLLLFGIFILWFSLSFLIIPNITVLLETFTKDGSLSLRAFEKIRNSERALAAIRHSLLLAVVLTITVNIVGIFIVLVTEYFEVKFAGILRIAFMSTLVFGGMILNNGYLYLYGHKGIITRGLTKIIPGLDPKWFIGFPAVLFVMTFACTSNHMLFFRNAIKGIDFGTVEAAKNMGANQWQILRKVVLPTLKPTILTLLIMTFQTGLGAMSAPLMVGGEDFQTISPLILTFAKRPASRDIAALLSVLLGIAQIVLLFVITRNEKKGNFLSISKTKTHIQKQKIHNKVINGIVHVISYVLFFIYSLPVILVTLFSFMDTKAINASKLSIHSFTLDNYRRILTDASSYRPFINSVMYSAMAAAGAVILCVVVVRIVMKYNSVWTTMMEYVLYIPWLLPALLLAIGLILTYDRPRPWMFGRVLVGRPWIVPLAYFIVMIPSTIRYIKAAYFSFDRNLEDAARNLGAGGFRTMFKIIIPVLLPTALALFALNFNSYLADYDLSAFLYHPTHPTLGIVIRSNADPTANVNAQAINLVYSVILMGISTIVLYFVYGRGSDTFSRRDKRKQKKIKESKK
ncbi:MAG: ABC transporter permease subunit [Tissierellia bacterium]|nr:ABC transporter permease subunit [Tissierellia bacterium]